MPDLEIRKLVSVLEVTRREQGTDVPGSRRKVATGLVMANPLAGRYHDDLTELVELGAAVGQALVEEALAVLGAPAADVRAYGKAAVVGIDGEIEHAAAVIHPRFGAPVRAALGRGPAIIPSTKLVGGPGTRIVAPLTNCDDIWEFDEMDAIALSVDDAPRPDELLVVLALAVGGRPLHRVRKPA